MKRALAIAFVLIMTCSTALAYVIMTHALPLHGWQKKTRF